jgi:hypothetical protein
MNIISISVSIFSSMLLARELNELVILWIEGNTALIKAATATTLAITSNDVVITSLAIMTPIFHY